MSDVWVGVLTQKLCGLDPTGVQEKMGIMNRGVVYGLWDYDKEGIDELCFLEGDCMTIVRREDEDEVEWWWARIGNMEGYIPRNLLGVSAKSNWHLLERKTRVFLQYPNHDGSEHTLRTVLP